MSDDGRYGQDPAITAGFRHDEPSPAYGPSDPLEVNLGEVPVPGLDDGTGAQGAAFPSAIPRLEDVLLPDGGDRSSRRERRKAEQEAAGAAEYAAHASPSPPAQAAVHHEEFVVPADPSYAHREDGSAAQAGIYDPPQYDPPQYGTPEFAAPELDAAHYPVAPEPYSPLAAAPESRDAVAGAFDAPPQVDGFSPVDMPPPAYPDAGAYAGQYSEPPVAGFDAPPPVADLPDAPPPSGPPAEFDPYGQAPPPAQISGITAGYADSVNPVPVDHFDAESEPAPLSADGAEYFAVPALEAEPEPEPPPEPLPAAPSMYDGVPDMPPPSMGVGADMGYGVGVPASYDDGYGSGWEAAGAEAVGYIGADPDFSGYSPQAYEMAPPPPMPDPDQIEAEVTTAAFSELSSLSAERPKVERTRAGLTRREASADTGAQELGDGSIAPATRDADATRSRYTNFYSGTTRAKADAVQSGEKVPGHAGGQA